MDSRNLQPNATGSGHQYSFNTISSYNTIYNTNYTNEEQKILGWLSPLEPRMRHQDVSTRRRDGLGSWFLKNEEFVRWRDSKDGSGKATLFCSGNPGVGKAYMSSLVIDTICDQMEGNKVAVAYLYCDFQGLKEQTPANMIGALVKQLVCALGTVPGEINTAFQKAERDGRGLRLPDILELSKAILASLERVFICIDALDECPDRVLPELLSSLRAISQGSPGVRLFLTGRPHVQGLVEKYFPDRAHDIPISTDSADIREYLAKELDQDSIPEAMDPTLEAEIMHLIPERISGAFLLVSLTIATILGETTIHKRREQLKKITSGGLGLDDAYLETLNRIMAKRGGQSKLGMDALMWISRSERPMTSEELCFALGVEIGSQDVNSQNIPDIKTVLASCLGLVTVDESSTLWLVHFTFQEYLDSHPEYYGNAYTTMAEVCLTYLNHDSVNKLPTSLTLAPKCAPFLEYASTYWGFFVTRQMTEGVKSLALQLLDEFDQHISAKILCWEMLYRTQSPTGFTGLHCAAYMGLQEIVISLLENKDLDMSMTDFLGCAPLSWAADNGHEEIVNLLLDRKEVKPDSKDNYGNTPLLLAASGGHEGIVKLLLDRKEVNPDLKGWYDGIPLLLAASGGHEGIVKLLLDRKEVNPDSKGNYGSTPLLLAARNGHEGIVKLLLARKEVNPDSKNNDGSTPLLLAAGKGHKGIVKLLLGRKEVNPDSKDNDGNTPLLLAASAGDKGIVKLLQNHINTKLDPYPLSSRTPSPLPEPATEDTEVPAFPHPQLEVIEIKTTAPALTPLPPPPLNSPSNKAELLPVSPPLVCPSLAAAVAVILVAILVAYCLNYSEYLSS